MGDLFTVSDDGETRVVEERDERGMVICTSFELSPASALFKQQAAEQAAVEERRDVLRAVVDPGRRTPTVGEFLRAQAFLSLVAEVGVGEALSVADERTLPLGDA